MLAEIKGMRDQLQAQLASSLRRIDELHDSEVAMSAQQRDTEVATAYEEHRQRMRAVAAGLQAMGQSMSNQPAGYSTPNPSGSSSSQCFSDYNCGTGYMCLKQNYSSNGVCVMAVNSYGNQTFTGPRPNSVMPKMPVSTDCKFVTDCPIGFRCDAQSGACLR